MILVLAGNTDKQQNTALLCFDHIRMFSFYYIYVNFMRQKDNIYQYFKVCSKRQ